MKGVVVIVVCLAVLMASSAMAIEKNLIDLHKSVGKLNNKDCLACHGKIKKEVTLNRKFKTLHKLHLESKLPTPKSCAECHQSVDLTDGSAAALRKQVDPQICAGCHKGELKETKVLFVK